MNPQNKWDSNGWQPIETAPKDRTKIDILLNGKSRIPEVYWGMFDGYQAPIWSWIDGLVSPTISIFIPFNALFLNIFFTGNEFENHQLPA